MKTNENYKIKFSAHEFRGSVPQTAKGSSNELHVELIKY